ncbi:MAG: CBS domain-containing protein [Desulfobacteraceae bacterium]|nr:CBS domain-containing protein [Desulfobacteraceae bacterium]
MIKAKDIMTTKLITLTSKTGFTKAAKILLDNNINGAPVVDDQGKLIGVLCQSDLVAQHKRPPVPTLITLLDSYIQITSTKHLEKDARKIAALTVGEAMTENPVTVNSESAIEKIAGLMVDKGFHTLPVVDDGRLVGIIGKEDVLRTLLNS